ncbi:hypothetical protein H9P43_002706 [Blastocladiella emersonii ATCC 22665]|nr:hypothetical protein H9P43_002669 [Blastocladiella emersonii ATCC 22665]KAI9188315.1 hypothetical protein H9P43_002706 [Blastocladiella emersonii ATCC 22665]
MELTLALAEAPPADTEQEIKFDLSRMARSLKKAQDLLEAVAGHFLMRHASSAAVAKGAVAHLRALIGASPESDLDFSRDLAQPYLTALVTHAVLAAVSGWFPTTSDAADHARAVWQMVETHVKPPGKPMPRVWTQAVAAVVARVCTIFDGLELTTDDEDVIHAAVMGSVRVVAAMRVAHPGFTLHWVPAGSEVHIDEVHYPVPTIASKFASDGGSETDEMVEPITRIAFTKFPRVVAPADLDMGGADEIDEWKHMFRVSAFAYEVTATDAAHTVAVGEAALTVPGPDAFTGPPPAIESAHKSKSAAIAKALASHAVANRAAASPAAPAPHESTTLIPAATHPLATPNAPIYAMPVPSVLKPVHPSGAALPDTTAPPNNVDGEVEDNYVAGAPQLTASDLKHAHDERDKRDEHDGQMQLQMQVASALLIADQMALAAYDVPVDEADDGFDR